MPAAVDGAGAGVGIGGSPGAIEAGAAEAARAAAAIDAAGTAVSSHGDTVVANWTGSTSNAAHERIRFLGERTVIGADVVADLPAILSTYASALRAAQARWVAGHAGAMAAASAAATAATAQAGLDAEGTAGVDPGHGGRQAAVTAAASAAAEDGAAANHAMAAAVADEKVANAIAAAAVAALSGQMVAMRTDMAPARPSPVAVDWADGYRAEPAVPDQGPAPIGPWVLAPGVTGPGAVGAGAAGVGAIGPGVTAPGVIGAAAGGVGAIGPGVSAPGVIGAGGEVVPAPGGQGSAEQAQEAVEEGEEPAALMRPSPAAADWADYVDTGGASAGIAGITPDRGRVEPVEPLTEAQQQAAEQGWDTFQTVLDFAGMTPGIGIPIDLVNAGIYLMRGKPGNAGLSAFSAIPVWGDASTASRLLPKAQRAADAAQIADDLPGDSARPPEPYGPPVPETPRPASLQEATTKAERTTALVGIVSAEAAASQYATDTVQVAPEPQRLTNPGGGSSLPPEFKGVPMDDRPESGPLYAFPVKNPTAAEVLATQDYAEAAQEALDNGGFNDGGRVSVDDPLRVAADRAIDAERRAAAAEGRYYSGVVGHVPDTTWGGRGEPYSWMDLPGSVNSSLGSQATRYPVGYQATKVLGPLDDEFVSDVGAWPR